MHLFLDPMGVVASAGVYHMTLYICPAVLLAISVDARRLRRKAVAVSVRQSGLRQQAQSSGQGTQEWKP